MLRKALLVTAIGWLFTGSGLCLHAHSFLWLGGIALGLSGGLMHDWLMETEP